MVVGGRVVALELGVVPEALEGAFEFADYFGKIAARDLDHPLLAGAERGRREIGRAHVRRVQVVTALSGARKEPRLRVKPSAPRVVRNAHLRVRKPRQRVDGIDLGGAGEHGGEDASA